MAKIILVCEYKLNRPGIMKSECIGEYNFSRILPNGLCVQMNISYERGSVIAQLENVEMHDDVILELSDKGRFDGHSTSEMSLLAINEPFQDIRDSVTQLLGLLKYYLRHFDFSEYLYSTKSEMWGIDKKNLRENPSSITTTLRRIYHHPLDSHTQKTVQSSLDSGVKLLSAMKHLHRAKQENIPHHKWIDAAIAAELAIKEVLSIKNEKLNALLLEMPSPPIDKLYGSVMEAYLGVRSPYRKKLVEGQTVRNNLVHRPGTVKINIDDADDYVATVEAAIFHLLSVLYPDNKLIANELADIGPDVTINSKIKLTDKSKKQN